MRDIRADAKSIRHLLSGTKYSIDYYQREYKWETKQIKELLDDLSEKFLDNYDSSHERSNVADYGHYFLGSIIISHRDGKKYVIDGQQRLAVRGPPRRGQASFDEQSLRGNRLETNRDLVVERAGDGIRIGPE